MKLNVLLMVAIMAFGHMTASHAAIIYDNGDPNTLNGHCIAAGCQTRDDFNITNGGTIRSIGFYFQNYNGITGWDGNVSYRILSSPTLTVLSSGVGQNVTASPSSFPWCCGGGNAWLVEFDLVTPFVAAAGQTYWLNLQDASGPSPWWVTANAGFAFYLSDTFIGGGGEGVPAPGALALLGLGLLVLAAHRRRDTN